MLCTVVKEMDIEREWEREKERERNKERKKEIKKERERERERKLQPNISDYLRPTLEGVDLEQKIKWQQILQKNFYGKNYLSNLWRQHDLTNLT